MSELFTFFKEHGPAFVSTCADNEATILVSHAELLEE